MLGQLFGVDGFDDHLGVMGHVLLIRPCSAVIAENRIARLSVVLRNDRRAWSSMRNDSQFEDP
jgi:hypothetical protein